MARRRLVVFSDSKVYGGHEVMVLAGLEALACSGHWDVHVVYWQGNQHLHRELQRVAQSAAGKVQLHPGSLCVRKANMITAWFAWADGWALHALFRRLRPDLVLLAQGRIENGTLGALVARLARIPVVSYLPMAHSLADMGRSTAGGIWEWLTTLQYRLPQGYVTISQSIADQLRRMAPERPVNWVANPVMSSDVGKLDQACARTQLGLPLQERIWGLIGRVDFAQKGQDFMVHALRDHADKHPQGCIAILGDGPDQARLEQMVQESGLGSKVRLLGFVSGITDYLRAFDAIVMPSRYEGVPLTMLEALKCGIPVVAPDRDGMRDWLPLQWRYVPNDPVSLLQHMRAMEADFFAQQRTASALGAQVSDMGRFAQDFCRAVDGLAKQFQSVPGEAA